LLLLLLLLAVVVVGSWRLAVVVVGGCWLLVVGGCWWWLLAVVAVGSCCYRGSRIKNLKKESTKIQFLVSCTSKPDARSQPICSLHEVRTVAYSKQQTHLRLIMSSLLTMAFGRWISTATKTDKTK
jgi:hypothetical protein